MVQTVSNESKESKNWMANAFYAGALMTSVLPVMSVPSAVPSSPKAILVENQTKGSNMQGSDSKIDSKIDSKATEFSKSPEFVRLQTDFEAFKDYTNQSFARVESATNDRYTELTAVLSRIDGRIDGLNSKIDALPSKEYVDGKISDSEARTIKWVIATGISVIVLAFGVFTWYSNSTTSLINTILNEIPKLKK